MNYLIHHKNLFAIDINFKIAANFHRPEKEKELNSSPKKKKKKLKWVVSKLELQTGIGFVVAEKEGEEEEESGFILKRKKKTSSRKWVINNFTAK